MKTHNEKLKMKQLKAPDSFQKTAMTVLQWLIAQKDLLIGVLVIVAIGMGGFAGWQYWQQSKADKLSEELGKSEFAYGKENEAAEKQREAIRKEMSDVQKQIDAAAKDKKPADAALAAKKADLERRTKAIKADHSASLAGFQSFFSAHQDRSEGWAAGMRAVSILAAQKKLDDAKGVLDVIADRSKNEPFYQVQARSALAGIAVDKGNLDGALAEIATLEKSVSDDYKPQVLLTKAKLQILKNAKPDAAATIAMILEKHASSPEAQKAKSLKALLN